MGGETPYNFKIHSPERQTSQRGCAPYFQHYGAWHICKISQLLEFPETALCKMENSFQHFIFPSCLNLSEGRHLYEQPCSPEYS